MKRLKLPMMHAMWCSLCLLVITTTSVQGDDRPFKKVPAFDFADGSYLDNGINPDNILDRLVGQDDMTYLIGMITRVQTHMHCLDSFSMPGENDGS